MLTRVFQNGNSLAICIPKELAFFEPSQDVEIARVGDTLIITKRVPRTIKGLGDALKLFPSNFMVDGRGATSK